MSFVAMWFGFGQNEHFDRGLSAWERKNFGEAAVHFQKAVETESNERVREKATSYLAGALAQLGLMSLNNGEFNDSVSRFREALRLRPRFADVQFNLASALIKLGKYDEARQHLSSAIDINPNYAMARVRHAALMIRNGQNDDGWAEAQKAAEAEYIRGEHWDSAQAAAETGNWPAVSELLLALTPTRRVNLVDKVTEGDEAMRSNEFEKAMECYQSASDLAPTFPDIHRRLGEAKFMANDHDGAIASFQTALELNPSYADAWALLGVVYRRLGKESEATEAFRKATDVEPNHIIASLELDGPDQNTNPSPSGQSQHGSEEEE
ncbi:MAG: tetratricopeptide repeat protein [Fimbriimonadaceae bacterium]|nr:tetratricopeptide repeat protein [Fimbriimonadaceae bacterium]